MTPSRYVMALAFSLPMAIAAHASAAEDKAIEVMVAARSAMGGLKLEAVKSISATGEDRRLMGDREVNGEATIEIIVPDKIKRTEEMGIPGGPAMSRTVVLDGTEDWEDTTNRGGDFMRSAARWSRRARQPGAERSRPRAVPADGAAPTSGRAAAVPPGVAGAHRRPSPTPEKRRPRTARPT